MKKGYVLWFTGLSASGKTTTADNVYAKLSKLPGQTERLDGDSVRGALTSDLGFSPNDRDENIKRIAFVASILARNGVNVVASFITPYKRHREYLTEHIPNFIEVFVDAPLAVCEERDPKGLYKRARAGEIEAFTGIDDPYDRPESPDIHLRTGVDSVDVSVEKVMGYLREHKYI